MFNTIRFRPLTGVWVMLCVLLLNACGYHLRGSVALSDKLRNVYLQSASSALNQAMQQLLGADAKLVSSPAKADIVIKVMRENIRRRVVSLDSSGKANEFELDYQLDYQLLDKQGKALLKKPMQLELYRSYFNNQIDILAKNNEESVIRKELYQQAARQILLRAQTVLEQP